MMRLPPFEYREPSTVAEAVRLLGDAGPHGMLMAGGTDLLPNMKRRQFEPRLLIGLRGIEELRGIRPAADGGVTIGACTTLAELEGHPAVQAQYPSLARAASLVATPQIRNEGTVGGSLCLDTRCNYYNQSYFWRKAIGFCLKKDGDMCPVAPGSDRCWAISSSDTAPVVSALGARVRLSGPDGEREIPAQALYRDDGIRYLTKRPEEILTSLILPPADGWRSTYLKLRRRGAFDFPILGVAVALRLDTEGICTDARIVLGAVHSYPVEATEAQTLLIGRKITTTLIEEAALLAYRPAKPLDLADLTLGYRKRMVRVFVNRALRELTGRESRA